MCVCQKNIFIYIILEDNKEGEKLKWISASKLEITPDKILMKYETDDYTETETFPGYKLKLIRFKKVIKDLAEQFCENIIDAESQHSDLIPAKYEGQFKLDFFPVQKLNIFYDKISHKTWVKYPPSYYSFIL